ncbi:MAG TPA: BolA family transcriptional regulator [Gammaproteobacteria bacterium]|nr:BolA family transcriptional regulator [Gammaproteobacteria bacterium]
MILETLLRNSLTDSLDPSLLDLENESHDHNVPKNSETHFRLVIVSQTFEGLSRVKRHQLVYKAAYEVLKKGVHALAMQCFTESEWAKDPKRFSSPPCKGGKKKDPR